MADKAKAKKDGAAGAPGTPGTPGTPSTRGAGMTGTHGAAAGGAYDAGMARAYDALMPGDFSYDAYADYIESVLKKYWIPRGSLVADLGCGTGILCEKLARRGYDMIGIDASPEMLSIALDRAAELDATGSNIMLLCQRMHDFELYGTVAAFISTIDSLNYITDKRQFARVLRLVDNYLDPGGVFIFDLNTPYRLSQVFGGNHFYYVSDDFCYLWDCGFSRGRATFDLTLFTRESDGRWSREDELHRQRAYDSADIAAAARGTWLRLVGEHGFLSFDPPKANAEKVSYIFKKMATR